MKRLLGTRKKRKTPGRLKAGTTTVVVMVLMMLMLMIEVSVDSSERPCTDEEAVWCSEYSAGDTDDDDDDEPPVATVTHSPKPREKEKKVPKSPTAYNVFMKKQMADIRAEDPSLPHKDVFRIAATRVTTTHYKLHHNTHFILCSSINMSTHLPSFFLSSLSHPQHQHLHLHHRQLICL